MKKAHDTPFRFCRRKLSSDRTRRQDRADPRGILVETLMSMPMLVVNTTKAPEQLIV